MERKFLQEKKERDLNEKIRLQDERFNILQKEEKFKF